MRPGGGKQKGAQYERDVCVALSMWISAGSKKDLFWRSAMSGGRATVAFRKGDRLDAQAGDISTTSKEGHALTDHYYVECKRYADLNFGAFLTKGVGPLAKFWQVAVEEATKHNRIAMLIVREDRNDTLLMVPAQSMLKRGMTGHAFGLNPAAHIATLHNVGGDLYHFDSVLLKPFNAPAAYKADAGPMLKPGEFAKIMSTDLEKLKKRSAGIGTILIDHDSDDMITAALIKDLALPPKVQNPLVSAGITTVFKLMEMSDPELLRLPNFGRKSLHDVRNAIAVFLSKPRPAMPGANPPPVVTGNFRVHQVRKRFDVPAPARAKKKIVKKSAKKGLKR